MSLVKQFNGIEFGILMGLPVEELVGDANLVEVHHWMPPPVKGLSSDNFLHRIPVQGGTLRPTGFCLY